MQILTMTRGYDERVTAITLPMMRKLAEREGAELVVDSETPYSNGLDKLRRLALQEDDTLWADCDVLFSNRYTLRGLRDVVCYIGDSRGWRSHLFYVPKRFIAKVSQLTPEDEAEFAGKHVSDGLILPRNCEKNFVRTWWFTPPVRHRHLPLATIEEKLAFLSASVDGDAEYRL